MVYKVPIIARSSALIDFFIVVMLGRIDGQFENSV